MTTSQFTSCWQKICQLWPNWKANDSLKDAWGQVLYPWPFDTGRMAIEKHWQENGNGYSPDPKAVKKLLRALKDQSIHPKQAELLAAWPKMTRLEQCRYARDSYAAQAAKAVDDQERDRLQRLSESYASHASRLYKLHAEDCPPRYGDRTMMPEPWGQDVRPIGHAKREPEALNLAAVAAAALDESIPF